MASFQYTVTIQDPTRAAGLWTFDLAARAIGHARAQHQRPDGTRIAIHRRRLRRERTGPKTLVVWEGPELVYRRYEVNNGIVRRVDR